MPKGLTEACAPYDTWRNPEPVEIWEIVDRLTPAELRIMAISYALQASAPFERKLLQLWAARDGKGLVKPLADA
jgi:hypothetical protein